MKIQNVPFEVTDWDKMTLVDYAINSFTEVVVEQQKPSGSTLHLMKS